MIDIFAKNFVILESLTSKTPVITSKDGCFSEAGGPNSIYINPLSVAEMKKAILLVKEKCFFGPGGL